MNAYLLGLPLVISLLCLLGNSAFMPEAGAVENATGTAQELRLIPFPKLVTLEPARFSLSNAVVLELSGVPGEVFAERLNIELQRLGLQRLLVKRLDSPVPGFRLSAGSQPFVQPKLPQQDSIESYSLEVRSNVVVGAARDSAGLFYSIQTLSQLMRANRQGDALPCLRIQDWPSLRWRCFQDDLTRGPSSTLDTLKFEAALASYLKLNLMTYYMEYQFAFKKHPNIGPPNGSLTGEDLSALVRYAKPLHLDILGNQQSFGHFGQILKHPEYAHLRETPDVLTPVREDTYRFLDDLYSEVCPLLPFPWFNVCCDETDGLGTGPSKELAASIGVGGVYVRHIRRVHDLLRDKHNKRMMMWGDIILQHPDKLDQVPKDTIMLTWGYDARESFENQILPFSKAGYEFFICPGVNNWNRILPDFGVAITNIQNFVRDGTKQGAIGMLNTHWEDDAEALKAVKWHADAWAAECAWNGSTTPVQTFHRRVGAVLFGEPRDEFGRAVELLIQTHRLPSMKGMFNSRFWDTDFVPQLGAVANQTAASNLLALVRPALQHLENCRQQAVCNQHILEVYIHGARRMELIGQRMLDGFEAARLYEQVRAKSAGLPQLNQVERLLQKNREAHEVLGRQFAALWLKESKPYALDWTLARYTNVVGVYDSLLGKVRAAAQAAGQGSSLPPAEELGLVTPKPRYRLVRPAKTFAEPLASDLPWADASATHRLSLVVEAGAVDRFNLPIEVALTLPSDLAAKPIRAFRITSNQATRELLAQLDVSSAPDKPRLSLLLPGLLAREEEAVVQVYLGLPQAPPPLPAAVRTTPATNGLQWIENDQLRFLLGPEGAHIYRWEVKGAGNQDLTMPGETEWEGFSDLHSHRGSSYTLNCTARGPAAVEYECTDPLGHTKTLRLYGGTSWIEVFLSEPTSGYWDFDDPKNFAADGPTPGQWLFSDGRSGLVGRQADGVSAQVKAPNTYWGIKYNDQGLALGLVTPETGALHVIAPGAGAGGVGIESSVPARHFVTFGGVLAASPAETMNRLQSTLELKRPVAIRAYSLQAR